MSCPHGNWSDCDLCEALAAEWKSGYESGKTQSDPRATQKILVPNYVSANDANRLYGDSYGVDWQYEVAQAAQPSKAQCGEGVVAKIVGVDEYGPRIEWTTHWTHLSGRELFVSAQPAEPTAERDMLFRAINRARTAISMWENGHAFDSHGVSREIQRDIDAAHEFMLGAKPASEPVVPDGMWQIANLIDRLTEIKNRFGNTCVWFKECSWGAEALHAQAEHDEAMLAAAPKGVI